MDFYDCIYVVLSGHPTKKWYRSLRESTEKGNKDSASTETSYYPDRLKACNLTTLHYRQIRGDVDGYDWTRVRLDLGTSWLVIQTGRGDHNSINLVDFIMQSLLGRHNNALSDVWHYQQHDSVPRNLDPRNLPMLH